MGGVVKSAVKAVTSIFDTPKPPEEVVEADPTPAPVADEEALAQARRRTAAVQRGGRASTFLTQRNGDRLGS